MPSPPVAPNSTAHTATIGRGAARRGPARWKLVLAALLAIVVAYAVWQFPRWQALAETGSAYGARIGCSCRYVQGRDIASCATDFEPGMEIVSLTDLPEERAVKASVPLLASRTARFAGPSGCLLDE